MRHETWRPVLNYEDSYEVSDQGNVRSIDRVIIRRNGWRMTYKSQPISPFRAPPGGYWTVSLKRSRQKVNRRIHVLVAEAFLGPRPEGLVVCHGPQGMDVNTPSNLRWDTVRANLEDSWRDNGGHHNTKKTHCKRGHLFDDANTYMKRDGGRQCRSCLRIGVARRAGINYHVGPAVEFLR